MRSTSDRPIRSVSALLPIALSLAGIALVVGHAAVYGIAHEADEGTAARVFWLLMGAQLPIVTYFAIVWLPRAPRRSALVLAVQAVAWVAAWTAVYLLT